MKNRTVCFICVILFACASVASAQMTGGVKGGLNLANMTFSGGGVNVTNGTRAGLIAGGFVEAPVAPNVVIQPEALFVMGGTDLSSLLTEFGGVTGTIKTTSIDIPVLVRFNIPTTGAIAPFVYAGPKFGFLLTAKATSNASGTTVDEDIKPDMKTVDFGISVGGGVQFGRASAEVRYSQGLSNMLTSTASDNGTVTVKNRGIAFMVGYRF